MSGYRCEFMDYHIGHDYRSGRNEPMRCPGLYPPPGLNETRGEPVQRRKMTDEEAAALLVLVQGGWLKLELTP